MGRERDEAGVLCLYLPLGLKFGGFDYFIGLSDNAVMLSVYAGPCHVQSYGMAYLGVRKGIQSGEAAVGGKIEIF